MNSLDPEAWAVLQKYRRYGRLGFVDLLMCPDDSQELVPQIGSKEEPVLKCFQCLSRFNIGDLMWKDMLDTLDEVDKNRIGPIYDLPV